MTSLLDRLRTRRVRALLQLIAAVSVAAAIGLSVVDHVVVRVVAVVLLGAVLLAVLKLAMIALNGTRLAHERLDRAPRVDALPSTDLRALQAELGAVRAAHDDLRSDHETLLVEHRRLLSELMGQRTEVDTLASLTRRVEPSIADTAVLRHEVTYLRETVERLNRTNGSS